MCLFQSIVEEGEEDFFFFSFLLPIPLLHRLRAVPAREEPRDDDDLGHSIS